MTRSFTDQLQRKVTIAYPPVRIVSLVPSQTELLHTLGLEEEVVGITKFCVHPESWFRNKTRVGGTKQVRIDVIRQLQPELVIGNKEENDQEQIEELAVRYPVWISDVANLEEAIGMIRQIGRLTDREKKAALLAEKITQAFERLKAFTERQPRQKAAYFIWRKPYMAAGKDTFIHDMLGKAGFDNVFEDNSRYPAIDLAALSARKPDLILLSSEPYPFKSGHFEEFREHCPQADIRLVDGEMFSWYGSRLLQAARYLEDMRRKNG